VRQQTAASNRIHALAEQLFPGFLNGSKSALTPFTEASLELMRERFSAPEIARLTPAALGNLLRRHRVHHPDQTAAEIILLAREALPPAPARVASLQRTLAATVDLYACLRRNALELRAEAALLLATTPYVMLTSIPGIGFVLAAGLAGELGEPSSLSRLDSLCAYAGIVPRTFQSGGPDSPAIQGHASPRCNRILKDWTVQSAQKIHLYGPPELKDRITRWNAEGRHGLFAAARHNLRPDRDRHSSHLGHPPQEMAQRYFAPAAMPRARIPGRQAKGAGRKTGKPVTRHPVVATTRTRFHPFIPQRPNCRKDPKADRPENRILRSGTIPCVQKLTL
jgi:hypothetical protein